MKKISQPDFRIIKSLPSSLKTFDYYLVIFDRLDFERIHFEKWLEEHEAEIADELYETATYKNFYVIHTTSTRGAAINSFSKLENQVLCNRINCDSVLSYHCLGLKIKGKNVVIRTGFHEIPAHETSFNHLPPDWESMNKIYNGFQTLQVDKEAFFKGYIEQVRLWENP